MLNNVHYCFPKMGQDKGCDSNEMLFILAVYVLSICEIALTQGVVVFMAHFNSILLFH